MKLPRFTYHRPSGVEEAVELLARLGPDAKVLAGGQSLLPVMAMRLGQPEHLVDIGRIPELGSIEAGDGLLRIGAAVPHARVEDSPVVATQVPLVAAAMPWIGHRAIRNRGTAVGSIAHADPAAELPAVALALDAVMVARSVRSTREIPAAAFFQGFLTTALEPDELLVEVRFPAAAASRATLLELSRRHGDYAIVGVAVTLDPSPRIALLSVSSTPVRVPEAEDRLKAALSEEPAGRAGAGPLLEAVAEVAAIVSAQIDPPGDIHASAAYRRHLAGVLTRRALAPLLGPAGRRTEEAA